MHWGLKRGRLRSQHRQRKAWTRVKDATKMRPKPIAKTVLRGKQYVGTTFAYPEHEGGSSGGDAIGTLGGGDMAMLARGGRAVRRAIAELQRREVPDVCQPGGHSALLPQRADGRGSANACK